GETTGARPTLNSFAGNVGAVATITPFLPLFVLEPPIHYAHQYNGPVIERVLPLSRARKTCAGKGVQADACGWISNGACHLIIPSNGPVRNRSTYRRHELAHCNGWDHGS